MSTFTTRNGLTSECVVADCLCNARPVTAGAVNAAAEERWFDEVADAVQDWWKLYEAHRDAPKSDRDDLAAQVEQARTDIIDRFGRGVTS